MKTKFTLLHSLTLLLFFFNSINTYSQGAHIFGSSEFSNFGIFDLGTGGGTWSTERSAPQGYFSAVGSASYTGTANNTNAVIDGYAKHYADAANQSFSFPVGKGTKLRTLQISGTIGASAELATAFDDANPGSTSSLGAGVLSVFTSASWDWQNLGAASDDDGTTITVAMPDVSAFAIAVNLRLVGWDGTQWINLSGSTGASATTELTTLTGTIPAGVNITKFAIGSAAFVLPLRLVSFTGQASSNCTVSLKWQTADEVNTSFFEVESSANGTVWSAAGRVNAQRVGSGNTYSFLVAQNITSSYYRIKMMDLNGSYTYSNVIEIRSNCFKADFVKVFPNPVTYGKGTLSVVINSSYLGKAEIVLMTMDGKALITNRTLLTGQPYTMVIETGSLPAGTYILRILNDKGKELFVSQKIVRQ